MFTTYNLTRSLCMSSERGTFTPVQAETTGLMLGNFPGWHGLWSLIRIDRGGDVSSPVEGSVPEPLGVPPTTSHIQYLEPYCCVLIQGPLHLFCLSPGYFWIFSCHPLRGPFPFLGIHQCQHISTCLFYFNGSMAFLPCPP